MTAETAYNFLKPSLEKLTQQEKEELCRLIGGEIPVAKPKRKKKQKEIPVRTPEYYEKRLLETVFSKKKKHGKVK